MTLVQRFEEKGIEKGVEIGIEIVQIIVAERLLSEGSDLALINKVTGLSLETLIAIKKNFH